MSDLLTFIIERSNPKAGEVLRNAIAAIMAWVDGGADLQLRLSDVSRTLDQNAAMWPALRDFARQVPWTINGEQGLIEPEDWKDILTSAFELEMRIAPGLRGGFVMLGSRTSRFGKRRMGDFLTFVRAEGDERGVRWSAPARDNFDRYIPQERAA